MISYNEDGGNSRTHGGWVGYTRVAVVGVRLGGALGNLQVAFIGHLVESVLSTR